MSQHILPVKSYLLVWAVLLVLLFLSIGVAELDLHPLNALVAMTIAVGKMVLIVLYFMHVRYSSRLTWVFVGAGFVWLIIMIELTMSDYLTRSFLR